MGRASENRINFTKSSLSALERKVNAYVYDEASHLSLRMRSNQKISELRQKADNLYLEIQSGRDPKLVQEQQVVKLREGHCLKEAKRSLKDMFYSYKPANIFQKIHKFGNNA